MVPAGQRGEEPFVDLVARSAVELTRLGYLLCGDHDRAASLTRAALERLYRDRGAGDPVGVLVRLWLEAPGEHYPLDDRGEPRREAFRHALGALPPGRRAAVVLRYRTGRTDAEVAEVLGRPVAAVTAETTGGLAGLHTAAADLTGSIAEGLALVAAAARPVPVTVAVAEVVTAVRRDRRRRLRTATVAAGVLALAGVAAAVLAVGPPEAGPVATPVASARPQPRAPYPADMGTVVVDDRARRLTAQLAVALDRVLPGVGELRPGPVGPVTGNTVRAPLEFYTRTRAEPPGTYFAQAELGTGPHDTVLLVVEVRQRPMSEVAGYAPCPEFEMDCTFRQFPDGTRADVVVYTDPPSGRIVHSMSALRTDGTYFHVIAFHVGEGTGPPRLTVEDLFGFSTVFTY